MKIIIIIVGGGTSAAWFFFALLGGGILHIQEQRKINAIEAEARSALMPQASFYDSRWHNSLAIHSFQRGNYDKTIREFTKSFELHPDRGTLNLLAAAYYCSGDLESAIILWEAGAELYPDYDQMRENLANAQKALEADPSFIPSFSIR